jgi:hypothetical protein
MTLRQLAIAVAALVVARLGRLTLRVSPRLGVRLVRWAARLRYRQDPERAAMRAEELAALVDERPGRLLKLLTGLGFALHALAAAGLRARPGRMPPPVARFIKGLAGLLVNTLVAVLTYEAIHIVAPSGRWIIWAVVFVNVSAFVVALPVRRMFHVAPRPELGVIVGFATAVVIARMIGVGVGAPAGSAAAVVTIVVVGVRGRRRRRATSDLEAR